VRAQITRKEKVSIVTLFAVAAIAWLAYQVTRESGFLWMSQREAARIFTQTTCRRALEQFRADLGRYPTSMEGLSALIRSPMSNARWRGPYIEAPAISRDPWSREYCYRLVERSDGVTFEVFSLGQDGVVSKDDVGVL
jgi:general secretion pathway protein G